MSTVGHQLSVGPQVTVFREEDDCDCAYVIERGVVEVSIERNGKKIILGRRKAGEVFGEMSIIDDRPRTATITTLEPCELVRITREQIQNRISQTDPILRMYLSVILERFRSTMKGLQKINTGELPKLVYCGKESKRAEHTSYEYAIREIKLEREMDHALHHDDFELHFQPIIDLKRNALVGFESLIRWRHKERGLILPGEFLPTAEASGLIVPIGNWVFQRSCEFLHRLNTSFSRQNDKDRLFVSVNISAHNFSDPAFVDHIATVAEKSGISPADITLEITETALVSQPERASAALRKLKEIGFSIAIDDFGTGFSSLSYLHKYPFDTLKIDRSFVQNLRDNSKKRGIVASIATLADHLNLAVVAEGIETEEEEQEFCKLHCAFGQGYLYSRPVPEMEIMELMKRWQKQISRS